MKKWEFTLGLDVSKKTLDFYYVLLQQHIRLQMTLQDFGFLKNDVKKIK